MNTIVEICVDSLESALAAERGGADRIELCSDLMAGGLTPSLGLLELAREKLSININVMIRPRPGDFCYSELEIELIKRDIEIFKDKGIDGIVLGVLKANGDIDKKVMEELIAWTKPIPVTFHRAFDMVRNPIESLETLIAMGVERILTSGRENRALDGMELIKELVERAGDRIIIMPGAGIGEENLLDIIRSTGVREVHLSAREKVDSLMVYKNEKVNMGGTSLVSEYDKYFTSEARVENIRRILKNLD